MRNWGMGCGGLADQGSRDSHEKGGNPDLPSVSLSVYHFGLLRLLDPNLPLLKQSQKQDMRMSKGDLVPCTSRILPQYPGYVVTVVLRVHGSLACPQMGQVLM